MLDISKVIGLVNRLFRPHAVAILLAALLAPMAAGAQGEWRKLPAVGEAMSQRSMPAAAALGPMVYLFGGVKDDLPAGTNIFYNDLHRFDVLRNRWVALSPHGALPPERGFAGSVGLAEEGKVVVFGGARYTPDFSSMAFYNDLWSYDARANAWSQIVPANVGPTGRARPAMWQSGRTLYIFGGTDIAWQTLNDLWSFDLGTRRWTLLQANGAAGAPTSRSEAAYGARPNHGKLTVSGGITIAGTDFITLGDTWEYDLHSRAWTNVTPAPAKNISPARSFAAAALLGNAMIVHGGDLPGGTTSCDAAYPEHPTNELWRLDTLTHEWTKLTPRGDTLPTLKRHVAVAALGRMYVFSGYDFQCANGVGGQIWNESVYSYMPMPFAW